MMRMPVPAFEADARGLVNTLMALRFLWVAATVCVIGAIASVLEPFQISAAARTWLVGAQLVLALSCVVAARLIHRLSATKLVLAATWACVLVATLAAVSIGHGAHSLDLSFYPLVVCVVAVLVGTAPAFLMTLVCAAVVVALAWAETRGWLAGAASLGDSPLSHPITTHGLLLLAGFTVGAIMLRLSNASYRSAQEREMRFRRLLSIAAEHYWELDSDLRLHRADDAATQSASVLFAGHMLRPLADIVGEQADDAAAQARALEDLRAHRPFAGLRGQLPNEAGRAVHLEFSGQPKHGALGRFTGYWGVARDVTNRVHSEAALRRSESMLSTFFATTPDILALTELASGRFLMVNQAFVDIFGYSRAEAIGRTSAELGTWASPAERERMLAALREHDRVIGMRVLFRRRSGARISMLLSAAVCRIDDTDTIVINARDVTEDERARQEHAAILQRASIGIAFTREQRFASANPHFERMFGWELGALRGQSDTVIWPASEQRSAIEQMRSQLAVQGGEPVEREMQRRDGGRFWCRLRAEALNADDPEGGGTIWIAEDVTERHQAQQDLAAARDAAEAANRAKSAFLANTSHEIRTPLNGLLGLARLALGNAVNEAQRKVYVGHILESAQGLAATLSDILDLSKIEAGKLDIDAEPLRLRDALEAVRHGDQPVAQAKGLALELHIDAALPPVVVGDATRVRQILGNFVSNAIKFTERGTVRIEASPLQGDMIRLAVSDTGIGIDAATQQRLFRPFSQADQSTTRRFGGTGLGLSICSELARLMGGRVGLRSTAGAGSVFWADLPLPAASNDDMRLAEDEAGDLRVLHGALVLVAEDNAVNMMITVAMLEQWGVQVLQATDGEAVVAAVQQVERDGRTLDAVLMDVHMPQLSGHQAARLLREQLGERTPPIIALTAAALVSEREEALRAGMRDFLTKPINAERMRRVLATWVGRARAV